MANGMSVILLCVFFLLNCVSCELNRTEDSPCTTNGLNGTCVNVYRCPTDSLTYLYTNAGFAKNKFPVFPDICSYNDHEPVVCCTDCRIHSTPYYRDKTVGPLGLLYDKEDSIAANKCYEYFNTLPYSCRGTGNVKLLKIWNEEQKCHDFAYGVGMAVGGRNAETWEFPHMALLGYGVDVETAQWLCGGSVISERFILTAAHCTSTVPLGNITFAALGLLRRTDPKKDWKIFKIKRIIIHPEYKAPSKYHDIALLETETEIRFGKDLLPACLNTHQEFNKSGEVSGWGRLGHRRELANTLQVVNLEAFEESECAGIYRPHRHLQRGYDHEKQMCYGSRSRMIDTCEGDSGGPLQVNKAKCLYDIVGVTSYGKSCGILGSAGMYTRVSYYVPWIEGIVWPEETELKRKKDQQWLDKWLSVS